MRRAYGYAARAQANSGLAHYQAKCFEKARKELQSALATQQSLIGSGLEDIELQAVTTKQHLAAVTAELGDAAKALVMFNDCLETRQRVLGPEHVHCAQIINNIAGVSSLFQRRTNRRSGRRAVGRSGGRIDGQILTDVDGHRHIHGLTATATATATGGRAGGRADGLTGGRASGRT